MYKHPGLITWGCTTPVGVHHRRKLILPLSIAIELSVAFHLGVGLCQIPSIHTGMSTDGIIPILSGKLYCCKLMGAFHGDIV